MNRRPSQATAELIARLYSPKSFWDGLVQPQHSPEIIRWIADSGEPAVIPDLLPVLIIGNKESIQASAEAIHKLVKALKPSDYVHLDEIVRESYSNWFAHRKPWYSMRPEDVDHIASFGDFSVSLLGIACSHGNGYVRQLAVQTLGNVETGAELPFLLIRANDWVTEVRSLASKLLLERIRPDYIQHWMNWLSLVLRLTGTARADHAVIIDEVQKLMADFVEREILSGHFDHEDRNSKRFCFRFVLHREQMAHVSIVRSALMERDIQIRREAMRVLRTNTQNCETKEILVQAKADSSAAIRREALALFLDNYPDEAESEFRAALLDVNIAVREVAQSHFRKSQALDLRKFYSQNLEECTTARLCAALAGIGEVGLAEDAGLVEPFLENPSAKVRVAAIKAIAKLNRSVYLDQLLHALGDSNRKVVQEAAFALTRKASFLGAQRLWEVHQKCAHPHGRRWILFLLALTNKWDSITFFIQSLADRDDHCVQISHRYIVRWFTNYNRSFAVPTAEQMSKLRGTVGASALLLDPAVQRQMDTLLKSF
jgi:HEAT repeat protein